MSNPEFVDLADFRRFARYVKARQDVIAARHCARKTTNAWYRTLDRIHPELTTRPKLLIPDIKGSAHIVYDAGAFDPHHNLHYILSDAWHRLFRRGQRDGTRLRRLTVPPPAHNLLQPLGMSAPDTFGGMYRGQAVSQGYSLGQARVLDRASAASLLEARCRSESQPPHSIGLDELVGQTVAALEEEQRLLAERLPEAASLIFDSHLMLLQDASFLDQIRREMDGGLALGRAIAAAARQVAAMFERSAHEYVREKARDIEDLALRLLRHLDNEGAAPGVEPAAILVGRELLPSDMLWIARESIQGIVLVSGGSTAHISLLVRSLGIPMVIVSEQGLLQAAARRQLLIDGHAGIVVVDPPAAAIEMFARRNVQSVQEAEALGREMASETATRDGTRVNLYANINLLGEVQQALHLHAEGIGLYRTELLYLMRTDLPSEDEQETVYRRLLQQVGDLPVTFRTLDAGGDKVLAYFDSAVETNPALGLRSTRFTLRHPEIFDRQLRAILRASADCDAVRIMFPMIGSIDEWRLARARFNHCATQVMAEQANGHRVRLGLMVELPAVVDLIDDFAADAAFFSIGTNDFIQYTLGVDRTNEKVAGYYCPHHPAVLRGLKRIADGANRRGIPVSVCGEMAHDPRYIPFFIGIGVRELSVDPVYLPSVQREVARYTITEAQHYAHSLLLQPTIAGVEERLLGTPHPVSHPPAP